MRMRHLCFLLFAGFCSFSLATVGADAFRQRLGGIGCAFDRRVPD
jgi:hypothetical protein